jgi:hypothetical protein
MREHAEAGDTIRSRSPWIFASAVLAPFALRVTAIVTADASPAFGDLRGFASDTVAALLATALLLGVARLSRIAAVALLVAWTLGQYANFEHIRELDSAVTLRDAAYLIDPTFVGGSVLAPSQPVLLAILLLAGPGMAWWALPRSRGPRAVAATVAAAAVGLGVLALWPWSDSIAAWRQIHFLHDDGRNAFLSMLRPEPEMPFFADPPAAMLDQAPELAGDLDGEPRVPLGRPGLNVLLVVLEGVSGAHIPSVAADHRAPTQPRLMPELDALARGNVSYSTFLTHQRKTNRGLYSLLCGELPNLGHGLPKMSDAAQDGWRTCLPELLRDAGYATAYLQAAPLAFMLKDQFMPAIGFERVHGRDWFESSYARSVWGIDDRAFFEQAVPLVEELEAGDRPWFLTLLTVGTHHPFVLPEGFRTDLRSDVVRAWVHLDEAIGEFARRLGDLGLRDDTLILITSDESAGNQPAGDVLNRILSQNWGFLIALLPERSSARVTEPFALMDLPLSILDFLGLADRGDHFFGRSVFRRYADERVLFFANTNQGATGSAAPGGRGLVCTDGFRRCRAFQTEGGRFFDPSRIMVPVRSEEVASLRELSRRSVRQRGGERQARVLSFLTDPLFVVEGAGDQLIHGGQFVSLKPGEWVEVELRVSAQGPGAQAEIQHVLRLPTADELRTWDLRLADGQTLHLRYTYAPEEAMNELDARSTARVIRGDQIELDFEQAQVTIHRAGRAPAVGLVVSRREIVTGTERDRAAGP